MNLYVYLDESGNFDFSTKKGATKWITLTSLSTTNPSENLSNYYDLRHQLYCDGFPDLHEFHATEDRQKVRDLFLPQILDLTSARIDSLAIEKRKLYPKYREHREFYPFAMHHLLKYVFDAQGMDVSRFNHIFVCLDKIKPPKGQMQAMIKGIKLYLGHICGSVPYTLVFVPSETHPYLQYVDYCCWSIYAKYERQERRPYSLIQPKIHSDFDIFSMGNKYHY